MYRCPGCGVEHEFDVCPYCGLRKQTVVVKLKTAQVDEPQEKPRLTEAAGDRLKKRRSEATPPPAPNEQPLLSQEASPVFDPVQAEEERRRAEEEARLRREREAAEALAAQEEAAAAEISEAESEEEEYFDEEAEDYTEVDEYEDESDDGEYEDEQDYVQDDDDELPSGWIDTDESYSMPVYVQRVRRTEQPRTAVRSAEKRDIFKKIKSFFTANGTYFGLLFKKLFSGDAVEAIKMTIRNGRGIRRWLPHIIALIFAAIYGLGFRTAGAEGAFSRTAGAMTAGVLLWIEQSVVLLLLLWLVTLITKCGLKAGECFGIAGIIMLPAALFALPSVIAARFYPALMLPFMVCGLAFSVIMLHAAAKAVGLPEKRGGAVWFAAMLVTYVLAVGVITGAML